MVTPTCPGWPSPCSFPPVARAFLPGAQSADSLTAFQPEKQPCRMSAGLQAGRALLFSLEDSLVKTYLTWCRELAVRMRGQTEGCMCFYLLPQDRGFQFTTADTLVPERLITNRRTCLTPEPRGPPARN